MLTEVITMEYAKVGIELGHVNFVLELVEKCSIADLACIASRTTSSASLGAIRKLIHPKGTKDASNKHTIA